jgi:hypothetical protein
MPPGSTYRLAGEINRSQSQYKKLGREVPGGSSPVSGGYVDVDRGCSRITRSQVRCCEGVSSYPTDSRGVTRNALQYVLEVV